MITMLALPMLATLPKDVRIQQSPAMTITPAPQTDAHLLQDAPPRLLLLVASMLMTATTPIIVPTTSVQPEYVATLPLLVAAQPLLIATITAHAPMMPARITHVLTLQ